MESVLFTPVASRSTSRELSDPKLLFFSGGTALNSIAQLLKSHTSFVSYIMPISDNGGSTAEILRVIGGPAIGDIRSRLVRLADDSTIEAESVRKLLQHRLPEGSLNLGTNDDSQAKFEWHNIVEGTHPLWNNISEPYKETIRAFLVHFHSEILRQSANKKFDFRNGSIGNFFFTGARLFFCSLETAIFWFSRISGIGPNTSVIPVINHNSGLTIGVELCNGDRIHGQNDISHPPSHSCIIVDKDQTLPLSSPIKRVFYLNNDLQEIEPPVNPIVLQKIRELDTIVYGMGSLYTSIVPLLVLKGVGEAISKKEGKKVLLLNGYTDRETNGMNAVDFIYAIVDALDVNCKKPECVNKYVTHLVYTEKTKIPIDFVFISNVLKIKIESVPSTVENEKVYFEEKSLVQYLCNKPI